MRRVLLLSIALVMCASMAFAQAGSLAMTSDQLGVNCNLPDPGGTQLVFYYVVHVLAPGVTASQFSAPQPACAAGLIYLADLALFPVTIGNSQTGVAVGYGACLGSPIAVLGLQYLSLGLSAPCCPYPVLPDPASVSGTIEVVDCAAQLITGVSGGTGIINGNSTCPCTTVPTADTTWGGVKSLFAE